jgi:hypothetical protein
MSFSKIRLDDFHSEAFLFQKNCEGVDHCSQCSEKKRIVSCNKCGNAICQNLHCSQLFPHHHDTLFAICMECSYNIGKKFKMVIDIDKLKLLKRKIKMKQTKH